MNENLSVNSIYSCISLKKIELIDLCILNKYNMSEITYQSNNFHINLPRFQWHPWKSWLGCSKPGRKRSSPDRDQCSVGEWWHRWVQLRWHELGRPPCWKGSSHGSQWDLRQSWPNQHFLWCVEEVCLKKFV